MGNVAAVETEGTELTAGLRALLRSGVVALVGLGAGAVFLILGVAGVALQSQCASGMAGLATCSDAPEGASAGSSEPELELEPITAVADAAPAAPAEPDSPTTSRDAALQTAGGLIAGTFDALDVGLPLKIEGSDDAAPSDAEVTAVAAIEGDGAEASGRETETSPALALARRSVTSVPVGSDGQPVWPVRPSFAGSPASDAAEAAVTGSVTGGYQVEPLAFASPLAGAPPQPQTRRAAALAPARATIEPAPETVGPAARAAAPGKVRVGDSGVNVRSGPSGDNRRLFVLAARSEVEATHAENGWVRIVDDEDRAGWVFAEFLVDPDVDGLPGADALPREAVAEAAEADAAPAAPAAAAGDVRTVRGQGVNVRATASGSGEKLFALTGGTEVRVTEDQRGWLKITDPQGRSGWVYSRYLSGG